MKIREKTPVSKFSDFASELGLSEKDLLIAIALGEVEIVQNYLFDFDKDERYIDKRVEKNKLFIHKKMGEKTAQNQNTKNIEFN